MHTPSLLTHGPGAPRGRPCIFSAVSLSPSCPLLGQPLFLHTSFRHTAATGVLSSPPSSPSSPSWGDRLGCGVPPCRMSCIAAPHLPTLGRVASMLQPFVPRTITMVCKAPSPFLQPHRTCLRPSDASTKSPHTAQCFTHPLCSAWCGLIAASNTTQHRPMAGMSCMRLIINTSATSHRNSTMSMSVSRAHPRPSPGALPMS